MLNNLNMPVINDGLSIEELNEIVLAMAKSDKEIDANTIYEYQPSDIHKIAV